MKNLLVIDGFYKKPDAVREFALNCEWIDRKSLNPNYPGTESKKCFYSPSSVSKLGKLIGVNVQPEPQRCSFGAFAIGLDSDMTKRTVHLDACDWIGIVYLTLDRYAQGGTTLFYHKRTELNSRPNSLELQRLGYSNLEEFHDDVLVKDGQNFEAWEPDVHIEMRFNRLVLFRGGHLFHAPDRYFGTTTENGRLVQLFFFRELSV